MESINTLPIWALAVLVYFLRICDVSMGTVRTISVVNGRIKLSVLLGFAEILIWVVAISSVVLRMHEHLILPIAYAAGFASGNAVGIQLERKLALGKCAVRMITSQGEAVAEVLRELGRVQATFQAEPRNANKTLVFLVMERRNLREAISRAQAVDPDLFWIVERFAETSRLEPLPHATGWRSVFKMK